jgi:hypothetical protein
MDQNYHWISAIMAVALFMTVPGVILAPSFCYGFVAVLVWRLFGY